MKNLTGPIIGLHFLRHNSVVTDTTRGLIHFPHLTIEVNSAARETCANSQSVLTDDTLQFQADCHPGSRRWLCAVPMWSLLICQWPGLLARWRRIPSRRCDFEQTTRQVYGPTAEERWLWGGVTDESSCCVWGTEAGGKTQSKTNCGCVCSSETAAGDEIEQNETGRLEQCWRKGLVIQFAPWILNKVKFRL